MLRFKNEGCIYGFTFRRSKPCDACICDQTNIDWRSFWCFIKSFSHWILKWSNLSMKLKALVYFLETSRNQVSSNWNKMDHFKLIWYQLVVHSWECREWSCGVVDLPDASYEPQCILAVSWFLGTLLDFRLSPQNNSWCPGFQQYFSPVLFTQNKINIFWSL